MNGTFIRKEDVAKYGAKMAYFLSILRETCKEDEYTLVSIEYLKEWGLTCRVQQPLIQKAKDLGLVDVKMLNGKRRHIKLL